MKNKLLKKLKGKLDCMRDIHLIDLGPDVETWKVECKRQMDTVGYVDCYCCRCGDFVVRIVPNLDEEGDAT